MGKVTLYHPVSLTVIRAAAIYAGFRLGKMKQNACNTSEQTAAYSAQLVMLPEGLHGAEWQEIREALQQAFAIDVTIEDVWQTPRSHKWMVQLSVRLWQSDETPKQEDDLSWLSGEPAPTRLRHKNDDWSSAMVDADGNEIVYSLPF